MAPVFKQIAIIGVGLIGGSIARAALETGAAGEVVLFDGNAEALKRAGEIGFGKPRGSFQEAAEAADAVFVCVPVGSIAAAAANCLPHMKPNSILTDVGSTKGSVIRDIRAWKGAQEKFRDDVHVVPAHPIAGTEKSGPDAGFASLFDNRWCIITPDADGSAEYVAATERLAAFWTMLGSKVELMDAARHDLVLAVTSHIPHLIAYNMVATAYDMEAVTEGEVVKYSAAGFRDFTRIAASDPTMWRDVFLNNKEAVLEVLGRFEEDLTALRKAIRNADGQKLFDTFTESRRIRREIIDAGQDTSAANFGRDTSKKP